MQRTAFDRQARAGVGRAISEFVRSEVGRTAGLLAIGLLLGMVALNGLNVLNSYVGRDFMTAIEQRSREDFVRQGLRYAAVFAFSTVTAVYLRFFEDRLGLLWREWLTRDLVARYLASGRYYRLKEYAQIGNPDQRIADDVRAFTATTISFLLMVLNASFTILAFSGVLWSVSPLLFGIAVAYATVGSVLSVAFGRPLVGLNYVQSDREATLRAELVHVRENAESVALQGREGGLAARIASRVGALVQNTRRIIAVSRNLSFFTTGYNYGIQLIPLLVVGPLFIRSQVEFGVVTQSAMAFSHLLGAFSLIVTQFGSISSYAAVVERISGLARGLQQVSERDGRDIEVVEEAGRLAFEGLTLRSPADGRALVAGLTMEVPRGTHVLVMGPDPEAWVVLFRATAGLFDKGTGRVVRPPPDRILFLPERPYLPPGTLREVLAQTGGGEPLTDAAILAVLHELELEPVVTRVGGLDVELDWDDVLALGEQQLLGAARIVLAAPDFAVLQQLGTTLRDAQAARVVERLTAAAVAIVAFGESGGMRQHCSAVLELGAGGAWSFRPEPQRSAR